MRAFTRLAREAAHAVNAEPILDALRHALTEVLSPDVVRLLDDTDAGPAHVLATGRPLAIPDARSAGHDAASVLRAPVAWAGDVRSVLILGWNEPRPISDDDVAAAEFAVHSAAAGLARVEAEALRADGCAQDQVVLRVANALNATLALDEILPTLVRE